MVHDVKTNPPQCLFYFVVGWYEMFETNASLRALLLLTLLSDGTLSLLDSVVMTEEQRE